MRGFGINDDSKKIVKQNECSKNLNDATRKPMNRMTPFQKFLSGLQAAQLEFNETMDELRAFAEVMARKQNSIDLDEDGFFYVTATGPIDVIIPIVEKQLDKLDRIRKQRDGSAA